MERRVPEHEHPLRLRDLQREYEEYEDEHEEEEDIEDIIISQDFHSTCRQCGNEINRVHRYFYECAHSCDFALHKFCFELPATINHKSHNAHTLTLFPNTNMSWRCDVCHTDYPPEKSGYGCLKCNFFIDIRCAMATTEYQIIHHPSHPHPLVPLSKPISCKCDACGKEHKGIFYQCTTCFGLFIHRDCAFLPKKLFIQEITHNKFSHRHPLTLCYSFPLVEQRARYSPRCRVCDDNNYKENIWILKCEKCQYYTHLSCATTQEFSTASEYEKIRKLLPLLSQITKYQEFLLLPFPTVSDSILKHLFSNQVECENFKMKDRNLEHKCHPHPLFLVDTESGNDIATPSSPTTILLSCHDPMKKIELLCNGCVRPITSMPFYKCAHKDDKCNFVLHEWCTRLPDQLQDYMGHKQHPLVLQPNASNKFFSVFVCAVCRLWCNGFVYTCVQCDYHVDAKCAFIPEIIAHEAHPDHLMYRIETRYWQLRNRYPDYGKYLPPRNCRLCRGKVDDQFAFFCDFCAVYVHVSCAMSLPGEIRHRYDKHPMSISYNPVENHKSQYFCEICEEEFDPHCCFYHCNQCARSIHSRCAPHILQSERATVIHGRDYVQGVYEFVNMKFGGMLQHPNIKDHHHHPLILDQGIQSDDNCSNCGKKLEGKMIFKCQQCSMYAIDLDCCKDLSNC